MSKKIGSKKNILFLGLLIALGAAMYVNWYYTKPASERPDTLSKEETTQAENLGEAQYVNAEQKKDFFEDASLKRSKAHAEAEETLKKALENTEIDSESRKAAQEKLNSLADTMKAEADIESLIEAKTGAKSLVILGDTAEIMVEKGVLTPESVLQIKEIVVNKSKISSEKITLVEVK